MNEEKLKEIEAILADENATAETVKNTLRQTFEAYAKEKSNAEYYQKNYYSALAKVSKTEAAIKALAELIG